jgi:prepilin-type processing-associated H-X9-DG protein
MIALLTAILLPSLAGSRKSSRISCVNNLKQTGLAFRIWQGDNGDKYPMEISATNTDTIKLIADGKAYLLWQTTSNELSTPKILHCPADADHVAATDFNTGLSDANISCFFGLDAKANEPQMILAGDDNLVVNGVSARPGILALGTNSPVVWTKNRHNGAGNICLADGSVQQVTSHGFSS